MRNSPAGIATIASSFASSVGRGVGVAGDGTLVGVASTAMGVNSGSDVGVEEGRSEAPPQPTTSAISKRTTDHFFIDLAFESPLSLGHQTNLILSY